MQFSKRMGTVKPSPIVTVSNEVRKLKAKGESVISFSIGVPGFLPPQHVYDAANEASNKNHDSGAYLPGRGLPVLVSAFQNRLKKDGFEYAEQEICATVGGKNALFNLMQVLVGKGDEVLFPAPYWSSYEDMALLAGATPKHINCPASQNYKLKPEQLESAITPQTKIFLFNNPSNPTGMVYTAEEVKALADVLAKHPNIWIISDDIYDKLVYDGEKFHHLLNFRPELRERLAICQSVSKTYGMPGWRVGMVAAPKPLIDQMLTLTSQALTNLPPVAQAAGAAAFGGSHEFLKEVKADFIKKRDVVIEALSKIKGITCPKPSGAFYVFPDVSACFNSEITNDVEFCTALLKQQKVACVPGSAFGDSNAIRISYATDMNKLKDGLNRIKTFVEEL